MLNWHRKIWGNFNKLFIPLYADEGQEEKVLDDEPEQSKNPEPSKVNLETVISQTRREEKEKADLIIKDLRKQVATLTTNLNSALMDKAKIQQKLDAVNDELSKKDENSEILTLKGKVEILEGELAIARGDQPDIEKITADIRTELEAEFEVKLYREQQISENKNKILTAFAEEIQGKTKEEIDASVQAIIEKTESIKQELGITTGEQEEIPENINPLQKPQEKNPVGRPRTKGVNPAQKVSNKGIDVSAVAGMDILKNRNDLEAYKQLREQLGLKNAL